MLWGRVDLNMTRTVARRPFAMALAGLGLLASCGLPTQGPSADEIVAQASTDSYELIDVTENVAQQLRGNRTPGFSSVFRTAPRLANRTQLGIGDVITVRIFEAGDGGLFQARNGDGAVLIPNVVVEPDGLITLPYTGEIMARGRSVSDIEAQIVTALQGKAIEPQAVVTLSEDANNTVTVMGEVARPARVPLSPRGYRLSEAMVAVGGARHPSYETFVTVTRQGKSSTAGLDRILNEPEQNIALRAGDLITFTRRQASYTIMGSVARPADIPFNEAEITLLEAIGKSSGLDDGRADPSSVFLLRRESSETLQTMGIAAKPWWSRASHGVPTVYRVDMSQPSSLFNATAIHIRNGDVIYAANAGAVELRKALGMFGLTVNTLSDTRRLSE